MDRTDGCAAGFAHGGRISAVRDAACISYRNYGSGSEGPDNEIVGKGYRRLLEKAAAEVPVMTMTEMMIMTATTAEARETEEASAVAVQAGISSGVGMNRRFSCTAQAELSDALDKISQLCYNDENQFREGVIRV